MAVNRALTVIAVLAQQALAASSTIGPYFPQLNNTIDQGTGPVIPYNGTDGVPWFFTHSPEPAPLPPLSTKEIEDAFFREIEAAFSNGTVPGSTGCSQCIATFEIFHLAALTQPPPTITNLLIRTCETFDLTVDAASCESEYAGTGETGQYLAQVFQKMTLATGDMQAFCHWEFDMCDAPPVIEINEDDWFPPKPTNKTQAPPPSGKTMQVLHFSDWHLDPRYDIGSEANCSQGMCCRYDTTNTDLGTTASNASLPASRWGDFLCDTTADLGLSSFNSMRHYVDLSKVGLSIFTGDLISHDPDDQQSIAYVEYEEKLAFHTFKAQLGNIPVYSTLGNHDTIPSAFNAPNSITDRSNPMAWNYELVSSLWQEAGWLPSSAAAYAATHYGAYATTTPQGLRIISINSDFWYNPNPYNFCNFTNPDNSGILRFLIDELLAAETADQRVWIIGHVPSGGSSSTTNPTALFTSIVRRFSPATIAGIFFGHTHMDQKTVYYDINRPLNGTSGKPVNTTDIDYAAPLNVAWIAPSITPRTNYNAGWSVYSIDSQTFSVVDAQTYIANISDSHTARWDGGPKWEFEYDTRATYDPECAWPASAPLNATFWDGVLGRMMSNGSLVDLYGYLETKGSAAAPVCATEKCRKATICLIRSGSAAEYANC